MYKLNKFMFFKSFFLIFNFIFSDDEFKNRSLKFIIYQGGIHQVEMTPIVQSVNSTPRDLFIPANNIKKENIFLSIFKNGYFKGLCIGFFIGNFKKFWLAYLTTGFFLIYRFVKKIKDKFTNYKNEKIVEKEKVST